MGSIQINIMSRHIPTIYQYTNVPYTNICCEKDVYNNLKYIIELLHII